MNYNNPYQHYNPYQQMPVPDKRSHSMELAALVCGILAILGCAVFYVSIICGALAILFAILSRGGERTCSTRANIGLGCGISGLILSVMIYGMTFTVLFASYGGPKNFYHTFQQYEKEADEDPEEAYNKMYDDVYDHLYRFMLPDSK